MTAKPKKAPKLTDAERHERFKDMAREVGASEDPKDFERAFMSVSAGAKSAQGKPGPSKNSETAKVTKPER